MGPAEEGKSSNGKGGQALRRPIETHLRHYYRLRDIPTARTVSRGRVEVLEAQHQLRRVVALRLLQRLHLREIDVPCRLRLLLLQSVCACAHST